MDTNKHEFLQVWLLVGSFLGEDLGADEKSERLKVLPGTLSVEPSRIVFIWLNGLRGLRKQGTAQARRDRVTDMVGQVCWSAYMTPQSAA
jgi:hypothetical protein